MKVSINWAQHYSNVDLKAIGTDEILRKIGAQLGAVEDIEYWGDRFEGVVIANVVSCQKHPNADRLSVCIIDDAGAVKDVARTEDGHVQVVCGAPNVREGLTVAWIPPGATVPSTRTTDPFVLEAREIRGYVSNGMLASAAELGISDDHNGILEINLDEVAKETKIGSTFTSALWMDNEAVIDCENKMFTHRPDCFGIIGVAREIAGITGQAFKSPDWYLQKPIFEVPSQTLALNVFNDVPELVERFMAVVIEDMTIAPSPLWMQVDLARVGIRPINNIVDITNYMMQLTGQPMHAFDYDKIKQHSTDTPTIGVRLAKNGEALEVLSGKKVALTDKDIVVATDKIPADLAGVMGGAHTEIDATTKRIVLTCATFDMYAIRRATMRHGVFTDAATRYTKGQSPLQNDRVLAYAMQFIKDLCKGTQASIVHDIGPKLKEPAMVAVDVDFINTRLGASLTAPDAAKLLSNVEIAVAVQGNKLEVTPPFWRTDLEIPEDIVEEVGRLYGYDKLTVVLPSRTIHAAAKNPMVTLKSSLRTILSAAGANELLTYSFVHGDLISLAGQDKTIAYQLSNALSPGLQYYRLSLTPSLLDKVYSNIRSGVSEFAMFEINRVHSKQLMDESNLPDELEHLAVVVSADDKVAETKYSGAPYYQASKYLWHTLKQLRVDHLVTVRPLSELQPGGNYLEQMTAPFEVSRSAILVDADGTAYGVVGEYSAGLRSGLKLPRFTAGFEINIELLHKLAGKPLYRPLSRFPHSTQDISFKVTAVTSYEQLAQAINNEIARVSEVHGYWTTLSPLDIYQSESTDKHITFRIDVTHPDRTLKTAEVTSLLDAAAKFAQQELGAERI